LLAYISGLRGDKDESSSSLPVSTRKVDEPYYKARKIQFPRSILEQYAMC
jgi:hypothetical protein